MAVLLLRLAGPLQSWGNHMAMESWRPTEGEPTKSGIVGLLAAALGRERTDDISDLASLRMGVRVDQPGRRLSDLHTAALIEKKKDVLRVRTRVVTHREYLSDAVFLVGIEGTGLVLGILRLALLDPAYPLFLGRRGCVPAGPMVLGFYDGSLEDALRTWPWQASESWKKELRHSPDKSGYTLRVVLDADKNSAKYYLKQDLPLSFDPRRRKFGYRKVTEFLVDMPQEDMDTQGKEHDAMAFVEGMVETCTCQE